MTNCLLLFLLLRIFGLLVSYSVLYSQRFSRYILWSSAILYTAQFGTSRRKYWPPMSMHTKLNICALIKQTTISTLEGKSLKLLDKFTYLGSSVSSTEKDIDTQLTKAWTAIDKLSIIQKSDLADKMKRSFFLAAVVSILVYGCTTWTPTKWLEKKLDGYYTRMLRAILNKS